MKVDLTLVRAGAANEAADAVLRALAGLAKRQSQTIVAEGIETQVELETVLGLGFDAGQGYLLSRPGRSLDAPPVDLFELSGLRPRQPAPTAAAGRPAGVTVAGGSAPR
jgi:EAL domain-containing protein (putative c-di-GMP-specific phosphodiesterase class I)